MHSELVRGSGSVEPVSRAIRLLATGHIEVPVTDAVLQMHSAVQGLRGLDAQPEPFVAALEWWADSEHLSALEATTRAVVEGVSYVS